MGQVETLTPRPATEAQQKQKAAQIARAEALVQEFHRRAARIRQSAWALEMDLPPHRPSLLSPMMRARADAWADAARLLAEALGVDGR